MENRFRNVFISHIHEDDIGLKKTKDLLSNHGVSVRDYSIRSDNPNNAHSENYIKYDILAPRIRQSGAMLVYITPETKKSEYVNWEIQYAEKLGKPIIGVWAYGERGCEVPEELQKHADAIVAWSSRSIINALEGHRTFQTSKGRDFSRFKLKRYSCGNSG